MASSQQPETTLRQILVPLDSRVTAKNTIETAFMIAKTLTSHVKVLLIGEDPTRNEDKYPPAVVDMDPPDGAVRIRHDEDIANRRWQEIRDLVDNACARHHCQEAVGQPPAERLSATIASEVGDPATIIGRYGRLSDLIVFPKPTTVTRMASSIRCSAALFETGRPIVVTPTTSWTGFGRRIAIAWNNTVEASRAVAAAMPFLERADTVFVLIVETEKTPAWEARNLAEYLGTHGIKAETRVVPDLRHRPADGRRLLDECAAIKADLLVVGAPRKGRFGQPVIDPVTRDILDGTPIPVLMVR